MKCRICGTENQPGCVFCPKCGARLDVVENLNSGNVINSSNAIDQSNNTNGFNQVNSQPLNNVSNMQQVSGTNKVSGNNIIFRLALVLGVIVLGGLGLFVYEQIKLNIADEKLQKEASDINNSLDEDDSTTDEDNSITKEYEVGQEVTLLDGSKWYYMQQESNDMVTLLSDSNYIDETYYCSDGLNLYSSSLVKGIVENEFLPELKNSLKNKKGNVSGISARVISINDIKKIINSAETNPKNIEISSEYKWLFSTGNYWTMDSVSEGNNANGAYLVQSWGVYGTIIEDIAAKVQGSTLGYGNKNSVRPVITLNVSNIK